MISLDQVLLLQNKVETAVAKITSLQEQIARLNSDNDALRAQCAELTKSLEEKTELVSSLEAHQGKIEEGILNALNRLDTVENTILNNGEDGAQGETDSSSDEPVTEETPHEGGDNSGNEDSNQAQESSELREVAEEIENVTETSQDVQMAEGETPQNSDNGEVEIF